METLLSSLAAIAVFLLSVLFVRRHDNRRRALEDLARHNQERAYEAKQQYDERINSAEKAAAQEILDRPLTGDPLADLMDRLDRSRK